MESIVNSTLTANKVLVVNSASKFATSSVTTTELSYLSNISSNIQSQLNSKSPTNHASNTTTYGLGTTANYGHCKIVDELTKNSYAAGEVLSAKQGYILHRLLSNIVTFATYSVPTLTIGPNEVIENKKVDVSSEIPDGYKLITVIPRYSGNHRVAMTQCTRSGNYAQISLINLSSSSYTMSPNITLLLIRDL